MKQTFVCNNLFKSLAERFGVLRNNQPKEIRQFFTELISQTEGFVIIDFLDAGSWDKVESFNFQDNGLLTLVWHDFRIKQETKEEKEERQLIFPASLYSLCLSVNSIVAIIGKTSAIFLVNSYSKTAKEINKLFKRNCTDYGVYNEGFFMKRVVRKVSENWEIVDFHCTPIYSLAIIPKHSGLKSHDSKRLLYLRNLAELENRLADVIELLETTNQIFFDQICEKVNTARRILESALKIECCYREVKISDDYSKIRLGSLMNYLKPYKDKDYLPELGKMVELLNEYSHDSGKPIDYQKAKYVCSLVMKYLETFSREIQKNN